MDHTYGGGPVSMGLL